MRTTLATPCAVALLAAAVGPAEVGAYELTFTATGTVTGVLDPGGNIPSAWGSAISLGDPLVLEYTFETTTADVNPDPRLGWYRGAVRLARVTAGDRVAEIVPAHGDIDVSNDYPERPPRVVDQYYVRVDDRGAGPVVLDAALQVGAETDQPIDLLTSDLLPLVPPDVAAYAANPHLYVSFFLLLGPAPGIWPPWNAWVEATLDVWTVQSSWTIAFAPPVRADGVTVAKAGSALPLKFTVCDAEGACACDPGLVRNVSIDPVACAPIGSLVRGASAARGQGTLRCTEGLYEVVWKTDKAMAGGCFRLTVTLADGSARSADARLR